MYEIIFSKIMDSDIDQNYLYIKETLEAPKVAEKLYSELYEKLNEISENPFKRPLVQDKYLASLGIRSIKVKKYLLFYNISEEINAVNIIRFMHGLRDWINILKEIPLEEII
ncbi:MAG: type II toxin-antitoxin system RelE/ParE family toxin [Treponema sp.]|jgi:plasmid stabilization system protein ParE|nr:type II toxin-antitoxin system RelE/ParE family toxin [Treponema sp.]